jgi:pimeloyl-ACP methyl ester carboxylesterase
VTRRIFFLPGTGASPEFWKPAGALLPADWSKIYFGWPGLGHQPHDPAIASFDDLVAMVEARLTGPVDLVAQSMGGVIAARLAIARPALVRRLVLTVTSGGVDMATMGASDWRADYRQLFPNAAEWVYAPRNAAPLPVEKIAAPTLLLWGDDDPISPLAVGRHLARKIPNAELHVLAGGDHSLAQNRAAEVAPLIEAHLSAD